jgi:hypothetical protein
MVYDATQNVTRLQSYGWRQCRLAPGGTQNGNTEQIEQSIDAQARMIQVSVCV